MTLEKICIYLLYSTASFTKKNEWNLQSDNRLTEPTFIITTRKAMEQDCSQSLKGGKRRIAEEKIKEDMEEEEKRV
jgi:hypothetical protein